MEEARQRMLEFFNRSMDSNQPLAWFEDVYSKSNGDRDLVPWDWREPHPFLVEWANENNQSGTALVVGCGLGEDAAFLSRRGWSVTAFDVSETAVSWASKMHPEHNINWLVADLLNPPDSWKDKFDLVLEVHILQAIPEEIRAKAVPILPSLVCPGGQLVCIGRISDENDSAGPPWPLSEEFIHQIGYGLENLEIHKSVIPDKESDRFRAVWKK